MLENRDYMRSDYSPSGPGWRLSASTVLMIVLTGAFAIQCVNDVYLQSVVERWLALTPAALTSGFIWQFLTFQFFHVDLWHLIGNLIGLWFFGRFVEQVLGTRRFVMAYFGAGIAGGLLQCVLMVLFSRHFGAFVYGASAGVAGMFAIFARLESRSEIRLNFILPIRADILLWITAAISLFFTLVPSARGGSVAHAAHLGGILAGLAWVKLGWHQDFIRLPWEGWFSGLRQSRERKRQLVRAASPKQTSADAAGGSTTSAAPGPEEFISREVDPILDKISAHGIQSLTEHERKVLEAARNKMVK